jgi:hypothetical protein
LLLRFKTSDDPTMSDHRIMIGRSLCRNFAHHWSKYIPFLPSCSF